MISLSQIQLIDSDVMSDIHNFVHFGQENSKIEYLASGKFGDVFTYQDDVAFKVFKEGAKFKQDPMILGSLQGIEGYPELYGFEPEKFMVMERINGQTIYGIEGKSNHLLKEYQPEIQKIIKQAEERGWQAKDVHLNNMILDENGHLHLIDVGMFTPVYSEKTGKMKCGWLSSSSGIFGSSSSSSRRHHHHHEYNHNHHGHHHHHRHSHSRSISSFSSIFSSIFSS